MCDDYSDEIHEYDAYNAGYKAYTAGVDFDPNEEYEWRNGWENAEDDSIDKKRAEDRRSEKSII